MKSQSTITDRPGPVLIRRVVLHEEPEVVEELQRRARRQARSLGAEIRAAVRAWLRTEAGDIA